jgi:homoserine O-acetyltransferase/O-succinyltransferase
MLTALRFITRFVLLSYLAVAHAGAPAPKPANTPVGAHAQHQIANLGDFKFENGDVVKDFKVSYVTHGKLNKDKSNAILVMQAFLGDHHMHDFLIGPGKALDTNKYFIVATDFLGNSGLTHDLTTGPTNSGLKMEFPRYTILDSVNVEYKLLKEQMGISRVLCVLGPSIGAMKSYQFAVSYPNFIASAIPIMGSPVTSPRMRWVLNNTMDIMAMDSGWQGGNYEVNPTGGLIAGLTAWVPYVFTEKFYAENVRTVQQQRDFRKDWHGIFTGNDARDVHYQLRMWSAFNIGDSKGFGGNAQAALKSIKVPILLLTVKDDLMISQSEIAFAKSSIPNASQVEMSTAFGHGACCGSDPEVNKTMNREIAAFLAKIK